MRADLENFRQELRNKRAIEDRLRIKFLKMS
jgi:hypothetical protein